MQLLEFKQPCVVNLGDNRSILAYGQGTYKAKAVLGDGNKNISLQDVLYLPDLKRNLLSVLAMVRLSKLKTKFKTVSSWRTTRKTVHFENCGALYECC